MATGSTSCAATGQSEPGSSVLVPGSQCRLTTNTATSITPSANSGTEVITIDAVEISRSSTLPARMPARMPSASDSGTMTAKASPARSAVLPSRFHNTSFTGALYSVE